MENVKTKLRTRWSHPINLGVLTLYFILAIIIYAKSFLNPYLIALSVLLVISLVFFFGTRLTITDDYIEYQHWMFRKKKVLTKDIEEVKYRKCRGRNCLEILSPNMNFRIYPFFSVNLISIRSLITGGPYNFDEAQQLVKVELKKKRTIDIILVGILVMVFLGLFTYRLAIMNSPEVILVRITPSPEFPIGAELENNYSLYVSENRIWSNEDAASAALYAVKPEMHFLSKFLYNTYLVYLNDNQATKYYVIYYLGLPNELSYVFFMYRGEHEVYFKVYE